MKFKTVTIKEEVYKELLRIKRRDESFSEFFKRIGKKERPDFKKFYGAWSNLSNEEFERIALAIKELRISADKSYEERIKRLFE
jgi:predicted CopG family antitoxin